MTLAAIVVALAANYPAIAFLIMFGAGWVMLESGLLFHLIQKLSKPGVYLRHPFIAGGVSLVTAAPLLILSGICWVALWNPDGNWLVLIPAILFGVLGLICLGPLFLLVQHSYRKQGAKHATE
jgi:hypothetical protein